MGEMFGNCLTTVLAGAFSFLNGIPELAKFCVSERLRQFTRAPILVTILVLMPDLLEERNLLLVAHLFIPFVLQLPVRIQYAPDES